MSRSAEDFNVRMRELPNCMVLWSTLRTSRRLEIASLPKHYAGSFHLSLPLLIQIQGVSELEKAEFYCGGYQVDYLTWVVFVRLLYRTRIG